MIRTRRNFSNPTKRDAYKRSHGICECRLLFIRGIAGFSFTGCGVRLVEGSTFYEHINPHEICGLNDLGNCAVLTRTCWKIKTARYDLPTIAKNNRQRDRARGIKPQDHPPIPGTKRSGWKSKMRGGWERRSP